VLAMKARALVDRARPAEAEPVLDRCLEVSPGAVDCLRLRARMLDLDGE
jgi:hypothetical protein